MFYVQITTLLLYTFIEEDLHVSLMKGMIIQILRIPVNIYSQIDLHLTNVAVQKNSECYSEEGSGGKWDLRTLKLYMISKFGADRVNECFYKIQRLIIHTYKSVQKIIINDKHCFELYGLDIMIDSDLKPWLIETNASPSLTGTTQSDIDFKMKLLDDTFTIIDMEKV